MLQVPVALDIRTAVKKEFHFIKLAWFHYTVSKLFILCKDPEKAK